MGDLSNNKDKNKTVKTPVNTIIMNVNDNEDIYTPIWTHIAVIIDSSNIQDNYDVNKNNMNKSASISIYINSEILATGVCLVPQRDETALNSGIKKYVFKCMYT